MWTSLVSGMLLGVLQPQMQPAAMPPLRLEGLRPGQSSPSPQRLSFPANPATDRFAPFQSAAGAPQAADAAADGAADFDGDGNADLWFLTQAAGGARETGWLTEPFPRAGAVSVQMGRASSLGRYRPWHVYANQGWAHAASFRARSYSRGDRMLLVEPTLSTLVAAYYSYPNGDPRAGTWVVNASWAIGTGAYRIATRDSDRDGNDDIALLLHALPGQTRIKKLRMGDSMGWLQPESEAVFDLQFAATDLRLLDHDADGRSDVLVTAPGTGVFVLRDDGTALRAVFWLPHWNEVRELFVGDADRDGRDDFGMVFDRGILLVLSTANGFQPVPLAAPAGVAPFHAGAILGDFQGNLTSVVAFPTDGQSFVIYPLLGGASFGASQVVQPAELAGFAGQGSRTPQLISADVDGDVDEDVVMQLADRTHWLTLRNGEDKLAPSAVSLFDMGPVGETGYRKYGLSIELPPGALPRGLGTLEVAVFLEDITAQPSSYSYWGRLLLQADPTSGLATTYIYSQTDPNRLRTMIQNNEVFRFPDGITAGGDALLSVHLKSGAQRYESVLLHHDGKHDPNKSAIGVQWHVQAAPPKADMDTELLPWN
jgi:hypothetical protein